MKTNTRFLILGLLSFIWCTAAYGKDHQAMHSVDLNPVEGKALLVIYRPSFSPPLLYKPLMTINSVKAFHLPKGYHALLEIDPGEYEVLADWKVMHGPADSKVSVSLTAGETYYLRVDNVINVISALALGVVSIDSGLKKDNGFNIEKSIKVTRFHPQWLRNTVGGFVPEETLRDRYDLSVDNVLVMKDFEAGSMAERLKIVKFLLSVGVYEEEILGEIEKELLQIYKVAFEDKEKIRYPAYLARYLAASTMSEFIETVDEVRLNGGTKYLRKRAKGYMERYYGMTFSKKKK